jgi:flagellar hook-basal body complex protein FliE
MTPIIPAAISLFGAPLGTVSIPSSVTAFGSGVDGAVGVPTAPFADLITEAVGQVEHLEQQAQASIEGLISGNGVDVHEAMIATQKASMGFELMLSVRNKALAAYQQVLGMQF